MEIKNLELTEKDFQLLVEGLDCLPEKNAMGEAMSDMIIGMVAGDKKDTPEFLEHQRKREMERIKAKREKEALKEDIRILQGKLLLFKRFLIQQDALKQVEDMINPNNY
jgi:hypothetical protein